MLNILTEKNITKIYCRKLAVSNRFTSALHNFKYIYEHHVQAMQHIFSFSLSTEPSGHLTIAENSEPQEGQVSLAFYWVPAQVRVTFSY